MSTYRFHFLTALLVSSLTLSACDGGSATGAGDADITITGSVTNDASATKTTDSVDDADVRAREIDDRGRATPTDGETKTDSEGRYRLSTSANAELLLLTATKGSFESHVVVDARAQTGSSTSAAPMTTESSSEADVFLAARSSGYGTISMAEVASHVSAETAARIEGGFASSARVAAAVGTFESAERAYLESESGVSAEALATYDQREEQAYREFQARISSASNASVRASAEAELKAAVARSGDDAVADAEARETGRSALVALTADMDAQTRFELRKDAEIQSGLATSAAVEAGFSQMSSSRTSVVAGAGASLVARLGSASSESEFESAWSDYCSAVRTEISGELSISPVTLTLYLEAIRSLGVTLNVSLASASSVDAVVAAKSEFFTQAEASLRQSFGAAANAALGAEILALVEVH